jgi:hypothetical protein
MGKHSHPDEQPNLHPGQYDEGGTGGMATRELAAQHLEDEQAEDDQDD